MAQNPLINILTRSHNRPELKKCLASIRGQNYKNIHLIVSIDSDEDHATQSLLIASGLSYDIIAVKNTGIPYNWNLYCNELKARVKEGWFFYCDDDDWISRSHSINGIVPYLDNPDVGLICQYYRGRLAKPTGLKTKNGFVDTESIIKGKIGGSAIILHASQKDLADWDGDRAADYRFIKAVAEKIPLKFVPIPVVQAGNSGRHGS